MAKDTSGTAPPSKRGATHPQRGLGASPSTAPWDDCAWEDDPPFLLTDADDTEELVDALDDMPDEEEPLVLVPLVETADELVAALPVVDVSELAVLTLLDELDVA
jgi:hypothetical protein